jgi:hypothetical protein
MNPRARAAVLVLLFGSAMVFSVPDLARLVRDSFVFARLSYEQRRERVYGPDYATMRRFAAELPRGAAVAIVLRRPQDVDRGIFVNYYLYPRVTRIYDGVAAYRADAKRPRTIIFISSEGMRVIAEEQLP